jgi:hypothetical protein
MQPQAQNLHAAVMYFSSTFQLSCTSDVGNENIVLIKSAQIHHRLSVLMPLCTVLLKMLKVSQLHKNIQAFDGTQKFSAIFTEVQHSFLSLVRQNQPMTSNPLTQRSTLITFHLHLGLLSSLLPQGFPTNTLYAFPFYPMYVVCSTHFIHLDFIPFYINASDNL